MARPSKRPTMDELSPFARRLVDLMDHLHMDQTAIASAVGVRPPTISRIIQGQRSREGESRAVVLGAQQRLRLDPSYWTDTARPVSDYLSTTGAPLGPTSSPVPIYATNLEDPRYVFARASANNQDPPQVAVDILNAEAPADAPWAWWVAFYMAAVKKYRPQR